MAFFRYAILLVLISLICGCASIPYREITDAEMSLRRAQRIEAAIYAPEIYLEAQRRFIDAKSMMNREKYRDAKSLAQKAKKLSDQAYEETQEERKRTKKEAEKLLRKGDEIWDRYQKGEAKEYAPEILLEIKRMQNQAHNFLDADQIMDALDASQKSLQRLADVPDFVEKGKIAQLEDAKIKASKNKAENIIKQARLEAVKIIEDSKEKSKKTLIKAQVEASKLRAEELERVYPSSYRMKQGETLIDVAKRREIYNDPFMWPLIYKGNRDQIRDPEVIFPGQVLSIPREITFEEIIQARKEAKAPPPYTPPYDAYRPDFYRRYLTILPKDKTDKKQ